MAKVLMVAIAVLCLTVATPQLIAEVPTKKTIVSVALPRGVTVELPRNWLVLSDNSTVTLDAYALAISSRNGINSDLPFAANLYNDRREAVAVFNIRYYPDQDITQKDIRTISESAISDLDSMLRTEFSKSSPTIGMKILSWHGTKAARVGNKTAFITEYERSGIADDKPFRVRLVRVLDGPSSFTITVSYRTREAVFLRPICDTIISSVKTMR